MTNKRALEVLQAHNKWRRGSDEIPMQEPEDIGKALEVAIKALKEQTKTMKNKEKTNQEIDIEQFKELKLAELETFVGDYQGCRMLDEVNFPEKNTLGNWEDQFKGFLDFNLDQR